MACDMGIASTTRPREELSFGRAGDVVKLTWKFFDAIARAADQRPLHRAIRQTNDQPTRAGLDEGIEQRLP